MSLTTVVIQHSLSCGDLKTRSECMTVVCIQLLPHVYTENEFLPGRQDGPCFISEVHMPFMSFTINICTVAKEKVKGGRLQRYEEFR